MASVQDGSELADVHCVVQVVLKAGQRSVGACVRRRIPRSQDEDHVEWGLELYDFLDNDQYSNLDCLLVQTGACIVVMTEDIADTSKADNRKIHRMLDGRSQITLKLAKKQFFRKYDCGEVIRKLVGKDTHETNVAEVSWDLYAVNNLCDNAHLLSGFVYSGGKTFGISVPGLYECIPKAE